LRIFLKILFFKGRWSRSICIWSILVTTQRRCWTCQRICTLCWNGFLWNFFYF